MVRIVPKGAMLLVKPQEIEDIDPVFKAAKAAGIQIAPGHESKIAKAGIDRGEVVAVGDLCWKDWGDGSPWCKVGDIVEYPKHSGKFTKPNKQDPSEDGILVFIRDEDILAVIEEQ